MLIFVIEGFYNRVHCWHLYWAKLKVILQPYLLFFYCIKAPSFLYKYQLSSASVREERRSMTKSIVAVKLRQIFVLLSLLQLCETFAESNWRSFSNHICFCFVSSLYSSFAFTGKYHLSSVFVREERMKYNKTGW